MRLLISAAKTCSSLVSGCCTFWDYYYYHYCPVYVAQLVHKEHDMSCGGYRNDINIPLEGALHTVSAHAYFDNCCRLCLMIMGAGLVVCRSTLG